MILRRHVDQRFFKKDEEDEIRVPWKKRAETTRQLRRGNVDADLDSKDRANVLNTLLLEFVIV